MHLKLGKRPKTGGKDPKEGERTQNRVKGSKRGGKDLKEGERIQTKEKRQNQRSNGQNQCHGVLWGVMGCTYLCRDGHRRSMQGTAAGTSCGTRRHPAGHGNIPRETAPALWGHTRRDRDTRKGTGSHGGHGDRDTRREQGRTTVDRDTCRGAGTHEWGTVIHRGGHGLGDRDTWRERDTHRETGTHGGGTRCHQDTHAGTIPPGHVSARSHQDALYGTATTTLITTKATSGDTERRAT